MIAPDGTLRSSMQLVQTGPHALHHHPLLSLDERGVLHYAWTTTPVDQRYLYWSIHSMQSPDGGQTWRRMDGAALAPPVIADETGPSDRITVDDEYEVHTWLSSFLAIGGKAHYLYLSQRTPPGQRYVRYDLATGRREADVFPTFKGVRLSLAGLDGFLAARASQSDGTIYCVGHREGTPAIVCLASDDGGATWYDYAVTDAAHVTAPYAVGGCRELTVDGHVIGSFTDVGGGTSKVYFLKLQAGLSAADASANRRDDGTPVLQFANVRGQPTHARVRTDPGDWSDWMPFAPELTLPTSARPAQYQLKSRLGVTSPPVDVHDVAP